VIAPLFFGKCNKCKTRWYVKPASLQEMDYKLQKLDRSISFLGSNDTACQIKLFSFMQHLSTRWNFAAVYDVYQRSETIFTPRVPRSERSKEEYMRSV